MLVYANYTKKYNVFVHNFSKKLLRFVFYGVIMDLSKGNEDERQKIKGGLKVFEFLVGWVSCAVSVLLVKCFINE